VCETAGSYVEIKTEDDIEYLQQSFGYFHDSVITNACFKTGNHVCDKYIMSFGNESDYKVHLFLSRQGEPRNIELIFAGVKRLNLAGYQNYYTVDISGCLFKLCTDLIAGRDDPLILWSVGDFSNNNEPESAKRILLKHTDSYVIASSLRYRIY